MNRLKKIFTTVLSTLLVGSSLSCTPSPSVDKTTIAGQSIKSIGAMELTLEESVESVEINKKKIFYKDASVHSLEFPISTSEQTIPAKIYYTDGTDKVANLKIQPRTFSVKALVTKTGFINISFNFTEAQKIWQNNLDKAEALAKNKSIVSPTPRNETLGNSQISNTNVLTASTSSNTLHSSALENINVSDYELKSGSVGINNYKDYVFTTQPNKLYTIFLSTTSGDADIYGKVSTDSLEIKPITKIDSKTKSDNGSYGSVYDDETKTMIQLKSYNDGQILDSIKFKSDKVQDIILKVTTIKGNSSYNLRVEEGEYINGFLVKGAIKTRYLSEKANIGFPITEEKTKESDFSDLKVKVQFFQYGSVWHYYEGYLKGKTIFVPIRFTNIIDRVVSYTEYEDEIDKSTILLGLPISDELPQKSSIYGDGTKVEFEEGYCRMPYSYNYVDSMDHMSTGAHLFEIYLYEMGNSSDQLNEPIFALYNTKQFGLVFDKPWIFTTEEKQFASQMTGFIYDITLKDFEDVANASLPLYERALALGSIGLTVESLGLIKIVKSELGFLKFIGKTSKIPAQLTRGILRESNIILKSSELLKGISVVSKNKQIQKITIKIQKAGQTINKEVSFIVDIVRPNKVVEIKDVQKLYLSDQLKAEIEFYKGKEFILLVTENNEKISKPLAKKIYNAGGNIYKLDSNNNVVSKYYFKSGDSFMWGNVNNFSLVDIMK